MQLPHDLHQACEDNDLVLCVGSGLALEAGLPTLEHFASALVRESNARMPELELDVAGLDAWIEQGRSAEALGQLQRQLGAEFFHQAELALSDHGRPVPPLGKAIGALKQRLRAVYTTNLDRLVERAFSGLWPSFSGGRGDLAQRQRVVFKLRGTLEFHQSWVVTREQEQREAAAGSIRRAVFETAYKAHRLMLVGFAPGSAELRWLLDMMPALPEDEAPVHFIVLESCSRTQRSELERQGLRVLQGQASELLLELLPEASRSSSAMHGAVLELDCPYPGLESFSEAMAEVFYGRHAEVSWATAQLGGPEGVQRRWLSVEGASGVGKSSFVHAGVLPALRRGFAEGTPGSWLVARMRPGLRPLDNLAQAICAALGHDDDAAALAARMRDAGEVTTLHQHIARRRPAGHGLVLVVDQLEEAVTFAEEAEREPFGAALALALRERQLYLVTTLRADFVSRVQRDLPSLAELLNEEAARYALPPISTVGLREAIIGPAERLGVEIEPALVERIVADSEGRNTSAGGQARAGVSTLPLVAHALRGMWDEGAADNGVITLDEYLAWGGVMGTLSRGADALIERLEPEQLEATKALMLRLVRADGEGQTRQTIARAEALELAGGGAAGEALLGRLSGAGAPDVGGPRVRLLVTKRERDEAWIDLVHEALISDWGTLRGWIEQHRQQLMFDAELERRAKRWDRAKRPASDLPTGVELEELLAGRAHGGDRELHQAFQGALRLAEQGRRRARWRQRGLFAGGTLAAGGLAAVLGFLMRGEPELAPMCVFEDAPFAGVWDAEQREAVEAAVLATGLPFADSAKRELLVGFDGWSEQWEAARVRACEDTHVSGAQSGELLDRRMACLDRKRSEFSGAVELSADASRELVLSYEKILSHLPDLGTCEDPESLDDRFPLPQEPARSQVLGGFENISKIEGLMRLGKFDESDALLADTEAVVKELDYLPLELEFAALEARVPLNESKYETYAEQIRAVTFEAEAMKLNELVASLRVSAAASLVGSWSEPKLESYLIQEAEAALRRVERKDDPRELQLINARSSWERKYGDPNAALVGFRTIYERSRALGVADAEWRRLEIGSSYLILGKYKESAEEYRRARLAVLERWGPSTPLQAKIEKHLAGVDLALGHPKEALTLIESAIDINAKLFGAGSFEVARARRVQAMIELNEGRLRESLETLEGLSPIYVETLGPEHHEVSELFNAIGAHRFYVEDYEGALEDYRRALEICEKTRGPQHPRTASILGNIGEVLVILERDAEALESLERALRIYEREPANFPRDMAFLLKIRGKLHLKQGAADDAVEDLERALAIAEANPSEPLEDADTRFALARALIARGRTSKALTRARARRLAEEARDWLSEHNHESKAQEIERWLHLH